jgi:hypothetical protein
MTLATQLQLEQFSQADFTSEPEAGVTLWLEAATAAIESFCGRTFEEETITTELHDGYGQNLIRLKKSPVTVVTLIEEKGVALTVDENYQWYSDGRVVRLGGSAASPRAWTSQRQQIDVDYTAGYAVADIPNDLTMVCAMIAERIFLTGAAWAATPDGVSGGITGATLDGVGQFTFSSGAEMELGVHDLITDQERSLLYPYKRRF